jgi:hypothetical protein
MAVRVRDQTLKARNLREIMIEEKYFLVRGP